MSAAAIPDFLQAMATSSRARCERARGLYSESQLRQLAAKMPAAPALRLSPQRFDLIAELKLRSPAVGKLKDVGTENLATRVQQYAAAGAAAVSVLTEPSRFDGSMAHLEQATRVLPIPAMRKDFLVDPYQVLEARVAGAGGVLVIVRMLEPAELEKLIDCALELQMFVLVEAFDAADIEIATRVIDARPVDREHLLLGVNCRDLASLQIVPARLLELAPLLPRHIRRVAESGVTTADDAARVAAAGYDLALVGSALMQGCDPQALAQAMLRAGRATRVGA
jgi:indole-3-glycerol phosphate synthase